MAYDAWFRDAETGAGRWELDEIVYRSPSGGLLEVAHDLNLLKARSPAAWMKLWDSRYKRTQWPFYRTFHSVLSASRLCSDQIRRVTKTPPPK